MQFLIESNTIDLDNVQYAMINAKKEEILSKHKYKIFQGSDGRWKTTVPDKTKKSGRRIIAKSDYNDFINELIAFYDSIEDDNNSINEDACNSVNKRLCTLTDILPKWLALKEVHTDSGSYIKRIYVDWNKYYKGKDIANIPVQNMTQIYLDKWIHQTIKDYNLTRGQYYNMSIIIRQCLDYCCQVNILQSNPFRSVKIRKKLFRKVRKPKSKTQVFLVKEQLLLFNEANNSFLRCPKCTTPLMIMFNFFLGLRIGELTALKWSDIEDNYLYVHRSEIEDVKLDLNTGDVISSDFKVVEYTKSDAGDRYVYLNSEAKKILRIVKRVNFEYGRYDDGFIFLNMRNGRRTTTDAVSTYLQNLCIRAGIANKSSHKIRKTYISSLFDHNINIDTIRRMAGHESEKTTLQNYCFDQTDSDDLNVLLENATTFNKVTVS